MELAPSTRVARASGVRPSATSCTTPFARAKASRSRSALDTGITVLLLAQGPATLPRTASGHKTVPPRATPRRGGGALLSSGGGEDGGSAVPGVEVRVLGQFLEG